MLKESYSTSKCKKKKKKRSTTWIVSIKSYWFKNPPKNENEQHKKWLPQSVWCSSGRTKIATRFNSTKISSVMINLSWTQWHGKTCFLILHSSAGSVLHMKKLYVVQVWFHYEHSQAEYILAVSGKCFHVISEAIISYRSANSVALPSKPVGIHVRNCTKAHLEQASQEPNHRTMHKGNNHFLVELWC